MSIEFKDDIDDIFESEGVVSDNPQFLGEKKRFTEEVIAELSYQIKSAKGNEVFFAGTIDSNGVVVSVFAASRGNSNSVPINISATEKADVFIHNHPSGNLTPSDADLIIASDCAESSKGFYIINNDATDVYVVMEPKQVSSVEKIEPQKAASYLSKNGPLSAIYEHYEERPSQIELVKKITEAFNSNSVGVFEAGTGVGKSFAYLIPSMLWSLKNKERVVISTGTINLQQQLSEKDIPLAEKIIGQKIKAVLVKGRQNFICLRRLNDIANDREFFSDDTEIFDKIYKWSKKTKNGSKSDLSFQPPEGLWQRICSESDACMGARCQYHSKCFVMKTKKEASDANILIVNHHLLFADIAARQDGAGFDGPAVLPSYNRLIFDEAHGIENAATSFFSESIGRFKLIKQLNLLFKRTRKGVGGLLYSVCSLSDNDKSTEIEYAIEDAKNAMRTLESSADIFVGKDFSTRIYSANENMVGDVLTKMADLQKSIVKITSEIRSVIEGISEDNSDEPVVWETNSILKRLDNFAVVCKNYTEWYSHKDLVFWIQRLRLPPTMVIEGENPYYFQFMQTPLNIAPLMYEGVFEPLETVVCTSATIGIEGKFDYWEKKSGVELIEANRISRGTFLSPFPYDKNMVFAVPSDAPFPEKSDDFQYFVEMAVSKLIKSAGGKTLVLFTSYDMLRKTYDVALKNLKSSGITLLKQGDDDRFRLLSKFKEDTSSVLFATDSFWEGVDVPGNSLTQVIIVKLPFGVPSDPVFSARSDLVQQAGGNSFMELSVPDAVIKFRQGFGRLIRRGDDKGAVVVLDRRIVEKRYGSIFIQSIPKTKRVYEPLETMISSIKKYI